MKSNLTMKVEKIGGFYTCGNHVQSKFESLHEFRKRITNYYAKFDITPLFTFEKGFKEPDQIRQQLYELVTQFELFVMKETLIHDQIKQCLIDYKEYYEKQ